ncbi:glycogen debranching protein GlgX [Natronospirillum operosum]|uniref:Glycogen debranching protein GlgX n=1 Tax=Natronospirillum operosum TaxID=2759953 RepID=A0A4Z0WFB6_9GAMM|nr:glycogen debranching protein GlgX [Natronospirillum operosum]TGG94142.1 glycogen debranching protein GlgX [Natronospirillum operosum]
MNLRFHSASGHLHGRPFPLGAEADAEGCNFAVFSPHATAMTLCLFDASGQETRRLPMTARSGDVWHIRVAGIGPGQAYGLRADGPFDPGSGLYFNADKLLLDPCAQAISHPLTYHDSLRTLSDPQALTPDDQDSGEAMPKSLVVDQEDFDWQQDQPPYIPWTQTVIYETHVRGISQLHPDVPAAERGTYLGMAHPAIVRHLQDLGITAVQLLPIQAFMPEPHLQPLGLTNYWGYNPACWFAPDPRYATSDAVHEFKTLVRTLHQAGIEVIMDVVYNHTAEADATGCTLNLTGLCPGQAYRLGQNGTDFINDTGCGNTVNLHETATLKLVMDSLRFWVETYHVDGFRFDLAVTLGREQRHFNAEAAFFKAVAQDPILSRVKLIAEPWDVGPSGYQLGQFPEHWYECNDRYRDTVRGFWRGDSGLLPDFCTRLMGSRDLLQKGQRALSTSLNYVTYHDGFTLEDLVSYEQRHNEANGEHNRDGHGHNLSANYGVEGPTDDPEIQALRQRQKRNLLTTLLLSQGAVHLLGGDELGRTQQGNNNAYCHDNEINWYHWDQADPELCRFVRHLIAIRQGSSLFHDLVFNPEDLADGPAHSDAVHWFNAAGQPMRIEDWHNPDCRTVGVLLSPAVEDIGHGLAEGDEYFLWLINADVEPMEFRFPHSDVTTWPLLLDTGSANGATGLNHEVSGSYRMAPRSQCLLGRFQPSLSS